MSETISIYDDEDNEITVTATYSPAYRGRREYGAPIEPDEEAGFEIETATVDGVEIELTKEQEQEAIEALYYQD